LRRQWLRRPVRGRRLGRCTRSLQPNDKEIDMPDTQATSWRSIVYGTPVVSSDDDRMGAVREVLGSDAEDIFHGLRVRLTNQRRDVMIAADAVTGMSDDGVRTSLPTSEIEALATYDETATYHLASVGWLRKHLGWQRDRESDEEPG
jgi:hypothetical protein